MKLLLIGGPLALAIGVGLTILYFSLAKFFAANARALNRYQKEVEQITREPQAPRPSHMKEAAPEKIEHKTAAKVGS